MPSLLKETLTIAPNYLVASQRTYDQIEYVINLIPGSYKNVVDIDEDGEREVLKEEDKLQINGYEMGDISRDFLIDEEENAESAVFYLLYTENDELFGDDNDDKDDNDDPDLSPYVSPVGKLVACLD